MAWLALAAIQPLTSAAAAVDVQVYNAGEFVQASVMDHAEQGEHQGHQSHCWAHATCSPAFATASVHIQVTATLPKRAVSDDLDYGSLAFPPTAPPPRD